MIREQDLVTFLSSVATELQNSIRPNLTSGMALKSVDSINVMLGRLVAELQSGGKIASSYQDRWNDLSRRLPIGQAASESESTLPKQPLQHMLDSVDAIQHRLIDNEAFAAFVDSLKRHDAGATAWLQESAATLHSMWRDIEDSYYRPPVAAAGVEASPDDPELIKRRLGVYLAKKYKGLEDNCVESVRLIPGGQAKRTALFQLKPNNALPTRLVLRQDMENSLTGTVVTDEFDILKRVYALGVPLPEPILLEPDPAPLGGCFLIMREAEGAIPAGTYFPEERAILEAASEQAGAYQPQRLCAPQGRRCGRVRHAGATGRHHPGQGLGGLRILDQPTG